MIDFEKFYSPTELHTIPGGIVFRREGHLLIAMFRIGGTGMVIAIKPNEPGLVMRPMRGPRPEEIQLDEARETAKILQRALPLQGTLPE